MDVKRILSSIKYSGEHERTTGFVVYLVHVELALTSGQFSVAGGELTNKVMTAESSEPNTEQDESF